MEKRSLPLNFYCRSARLLLKKATFSRKSNLLAEELRHLKKFSILAFNVIPSHPEYDDEKGRKLAEDLEDCMDDVRERIAELEEELSSPQASGNYRRSLSSHSGKHEECVGRRQHIWERFARKLYRAAAWTPCFPVKAGRKKAGRGRYTSLSSSEVPSPSSDSEIRELDEDEEEEEEKQKVPRWSSPKPSPRPHASNQLSLDIRPRIMGQDSESCSSSSTRSQLMAQIAEATNLNLEGKLLNLQTIVMEMKDSMDGVKSRVKEEGKRWRGRAESLERKLKVLKEETEEDFSGLKQQVQEDIQKARTDTFKQDEQRKNAKHKIEEIVESSAEVEDFKKQVNHLVAQLTAGLEERLLQSLNEVKTDLKNEMNNLEIGLSKDVDNLRQEMVSKYESLMIDFEMGRIGEQQQLSNLMKQNAEKTPLGGLNKQLDAVRAELAQFRKQLQTNKQETMEARVDTEVWIKDCQLQVKEARHDLIELKGEQEEMKAEIEVFKRMQSLKSGSPKRGSPELEEKHETTSNHPLEFASNLLMVEKVEKFSKLYTGCLDDLQARLCKVEAAQQTIRIPEEAIILIEKERSLATTAAADAIATASKTKQMLQEAFATFMQIWNAKEMKLQAEVVPENLTSKGHKSLKNTVQRLNRQMKEVFDKLTKPKKLALSVKPVAVKKEMKYGNEVILASVTTIDNKIKAAAGIMSQMNDRIYKLENAQAGLSRSLEDVRKGNKALEKAAKFWVPKFEATAKLVKGLDCRVGTIGSQIEQQQQQQQQPDGSNPELTCLQRLLVLEDRVDQIASATYANLRLLDTKVEHASIGMRSALDIATETEDKCSNLGAELVKVFRSILSGRESPVSKKEESPPVNTPDRGPHQTSPQPSPRTKPPYNPLPAKPVKRVSLRFGDKGTIISNNVPI